MLFFIILHKTFSRVDKKLISICIATYKRPDLLKKLIDSVFGQKLPDSFPYKVSVLVCDNDQSLSAKAVAEACAAMSRPVWMEDLAYLECREKGLANVRNFLVDAALEAKSDFILFVDDDEYVTDSWLAGMMETYESFPSEVVLGPVPAYFETQPPKSLALYFERSISAEGSANDTLYTGNTLFSASVFRDMKLGFDRRFNLTGGEDTYLGYQILKAGGRIVNSSKAIAYELIPDARMNIKWVMTRNERGAATWLKIKLSENKAKYIVLGLCKMLSLLALAAIKSPLLLTDTPRKYESMIYLAKFKGTLQGLAGRDITEYK